VNETCKGVQIDCGGAYVGGTQDRILRVAESLNIGTYPIHKRGVNIMEVQCTPFQPCVQLSDWFSRDFTRSAPPAALLGMSFS
jgi:monoamine oxidase